MTPPRQNMPQALIPTDPAWSNDGDIIDLSVLEELVGGNRPKMREFALRFIASAQNDIDGIDAALLNDDLAALGSLGHHNIGSAGLIGATGFAKLCQSLEKLAQNGGDAEQIRATVNQMHSLLNLINERIANDLA